MSQARPSDVKRRYATLLRGLEAILRSSGADRELLALNAHIIRLVLSPDKATATATATATAAKPTAYRTTARQLEMPLSRREIESLGDHKIRKIASDPETTRDLLIQIARIHFGLPAGEISRLKNKELLRERIITMLNNKETHANLARFASKA